MTDTVASLLPPNPSPFERSMAEVVDARAPLAPGVERIKAVGVREFPTDWLPWLVLHYGLERIAPYVGDLRQTLVAGRRWQRVRGTPAATEDYVLGWLGLEGQPVADGFGGHGPIEEERVDDVKWWLYQIALRAPPETLTLVRDLIGADALSKNAGTRLGRIYGGHDVRPVRLDGGRLDGALLDDWSGVVLPGIDPVLSFGRSSGSTVAFGIADPPTLISYEVAGVARFSDGFVLDRSRLDDEMVEPAIAQVAVGFDNVSAYGVEVAGGLWPYSPWPGARWTDFTYFIYGGPFDGDPGQ
jgi:hypothetical protein